MGIVLAVIGLVIIWMIGSAVLKANTRMHHADKIRAQRAVRGGATDLPSWAGSRSKSEEFLYGIQKLAMHHGVPKVFLNSILADEGTLKTLVHYAAAMELEGASFNEQSIAVSEKLVEIWNSAPHEVRKVALGT